MLLSCHVILHRAVHHLTVVHQTVHRIVHHHTTASHKSYYHHGGILIEFAFSIPIIILLLLFVNDHYRFYELRNKIKSSAYLAASMLQQLGNTRTDKQLTSSNLSRISYVSCLNFFHTNTMFKPWSLGIYYVVSFLWVKRVDDNSYQFQHCWASTAGGTSPSGINKSCPNVSTKSRSTIELTYPELICEKDGDEKVLVVCYYRKKTSLFSKHELGFVLLEPNIKRGPDGSTNNFFIYSLVIRPKPGLFPGKN